MTLFYRKLQGVAVKSKIPILALMTATLAFGPAGAAFSADAASLASPLDKVGKASQRRGVAKKASKNQ